MLRFSYTSVFDTVPDTYGLQLLLHRFNTLMDSSNTTAEILPSLTRNNEAGILNHISPLLLSWELLDTLNEVLVTRPVARNKLSNQRNSAKAPSLIHLVEDWVGDTTKLQACKDTTWFQYTVCLPQCLLLIGEIPDSERHSVQINRVVLDWQLLGIRNQPVQVLGGSIWGLKTALPALGQHVWVDVGDGDAGVWGVIDVVCVVEHAERDVTGAAGDVEDVPSLGWGWTGGGGEGVGVGAWIQGTHEVVFP